MPNIDLDNEFLELFYSITNTKVPANVDTTAIKQQLINVVDLIREMSANLKPNFVSKTMANEEENEQKGPGILVVDDLGVITYQLRVLLSQFGYDVDCSQEIYDAVGKFKKRTYSYVVMDLFIPTEREGFILLTELRKMALAHGGKCVIGVITASPRKEIEHQCKMKGADFYIEKNNDWQKTLFDVMNEYISAEKGEEDDF